MAPESVFLKLLFQRLNAGNFQYAVMRNYKSLPYGSGGSDLDIIFSPADLKRAIKLVLSVVREVGGVPIGVANAAGITKILAVGQNNSAEQAWWGVCVDLFPGFYFGGISLLSESMQWLTADHLGIRVLSDGFAGVLGVLKEALNNGEFSERYAPAARYALAHDWARICQLLSPMGEAGLVQLKQLLELNASAEELKSGCRRLRYEVLLHAFTHRPIFSLMQTLSYQWSKIHRYLKPSGIVVAILGVDGAGKSTVIDAIKPALNAATHNAMKIRHLRPGLLPPLAWLKRNGPTSSGPVLAPHGKPTSGKFGSLFRLAYLSLDFHLGYWFWTRHQIAKLPNIVLFDRYAYDMALDPRRFRISLPERFIAWVVGLMPSPDLIICLHGSPEVIAARKCELSVEETRRQIDALLAFASVNTCAVLIATDTGIDETRDKVLRAICDFLKRKTGAGT